MMMIKTLLPLALVFLVRYVVYILTYPFMHLDYLVEFQLILPKICIGSHQNSEDKQHVHDMVLTLCELFFFRRSLVQFIHQYKCLLICMSNLAKEKPKELEFSSHN